MSERSDHNLRGLSIEMGRRIDAICRRFEAEWRAGKTPAIDDWLVDLSDEFRPTLRVELEALERELHHSDDTIDVPKSGATLLGARPASTIAEGPTTASVPTPTPLPCERPSPVPNDVTSPPRNDPTVDLDSANPDQSEPSSPTNIRYFGDYEIIREIARGGMGVVFEARQVSLNRRVALKMILAGQLANDTDVKRFYTEAEAAANLDHPGIVPIYEVGQYANQHYFSMGFVEGQSLFQRLASGPLPCREAAEFIQRVSEAIDYAHQRGVIHRDLKPANILVDRTGNPRVTDFGLAKKVQSDSELTGSGQIMGTPSYMPPEQASDRRRPIGPTADVYALGATLYALVTGRPPFQAATVIDTVLMVLNDDPVRPRRLNPAVDGDLEVVCLKCLEKDPTRRYASAGALAEELGRWLRGEPITARPASALARTVKWARRRPAMAALVTISALATLLLIGTLAIAYLRVSAAQSRTRIALGQRGDALQKLAVEQAATGKALERERQGAYDRRIAQAQGEWLSNDVARSRTILDECEPARRGWEWKHLRAILYPESRDFWGHTWQVNALAFRPDGKVLATAGAMLGSANGERELNFWDLETGQALPKLLTDHDRHGSLTGIAFDPTGRRIALAVWCNGDPRDHDAGFVDVWEVDRKRRVFKLERHTDFVEAVAWSGDGKTIASASSDRTVRLWDTATGKERLVLRGHEGVVRCVAFSPDSTLVASGGDAFENNMGRNAGHDVTLRVWESLGGKLRAELRGHQTGILAVAFRPDGKWLATASRDHTVKLWEPATGRSLRTFWGHTADVTSLAWSPDGRVLASVSTDRTLRLWDPETGRPLETYPGHTHEIRAVAFHPDGNSLASAGGDFGGLGHVKLWNATQPPNGMRLAGHIGAVSAISFNPDGRLIASADAGLEHQPGRAYVWKTDAQGKPVPSSPLLAAVSSEERGTSVNFLNDGRLVTSGEDRWFKLWDVERRRGATTFVVRASGFARPLWITLPDGARAIIARSSGAGARDQLELVDTTTGSMIRGPMTVKDANFKLLAASADGRRIATAGEFTGAEGPNQRTHHFWVWDVDTTQVVAQFSAVLTPMTHSDGKAGVAQPALVSIVTMALDPKGSRLATADDRGAIRIWDVAAGKTVWTLAGLTGANRALAFSPDGKVFAAGGVDETIHLFDANSGLPLQTLRGHLGPVNALAFRPDGKVLASAASDRTATTWEVGSGARIGTFQADMALAGIAWTRDGRRLAAVGGRWAQAYFESDCPGEVRIWDRATGRLRHSFGYFGGRIVKIAFRADGRLVTLENHGAVKVLDCETGGCVASIVPSGTPDVEQHSGELAPDGSRFVVSRGGALRLWDVDAARELARIKGGKESIVLSTDGRPFTAPVAIFSPDSRRLAVLTDDTSTVTVCDAANGRRLFEVGAYKGYLSGLAFSPDGRRMVTISGDDSAIRIWDIEDGRLVRAITAVPVLLANPAFSFDGRWLAAMGRFRGDDVWLWDLESAGPPTILRGGNQGTRHHAALSFTPHGRLISAGPGPTVKVWNLETGAELLRFQGATGPLALSPDGRAVASAGQSGVLRIWDSHPVSENKMLDEAASRRVEALYHQLYLRTSVLATVDADTRLGDPLRGLVHALIDRHVEDFEGFTRSVRSLLRADDADTIAVEDARTRAEAANKYYEEAAIPELLTTVGMARFRAGDNRAAIEAFEKVTATGRGIEPETLGYLALAYHRLGQLKQAHEALDRLRELLKTLDRQDPSEAQSLRVKVEAALGP